MTRIIIHPNDRVQIQLESPLPAAALAASINAGEIPAFILEQYPGEIPRLHAVRAGTLVVILPAESPMDHASTTPVLSARQQAVLQALAQGLTSGQIARQLGFSPRTVEYHLSVLRKRLGEGSRPQLVARAVLLGLIKSKGD